MEPQSGTRSKRGLELRTPLTVEKLLNLYERNKPAGFQGASNSCYFDTTIFAMFGLNDSFDYILTSPVENENELARVMHGMLVELVNDLRKNGYVKSERKQDLREMMNDFFSQPYLNLSWTEQENDPVDLIEALFGIIFQIKPIFRPDGITSTNVCVLMPKTRDKSRWPNYGTYQSIASYDQMNFQLNEIPENLILKLPIFLSEVTKQESWVQYSIPSPILDITDNLDLEPKQCCICGVQATVKCSKCFGIYSENLNGVFFCKRDVTKCHDSVSENRDAHYEESLDIDGNEDKSSMFPKRVVMHLHAVICYYRSHYTCFVKSGVDKGGQWLYYNSMEGTDNKGDYISEIAPADEFAEWTRTRSIRKLLQATPVELDKQEFPDLPDWNQNKRNLGEKVNMLYRNATIAFYNQPEKMYT